MILKKRLTTEGAEFSEKKIGDFTLGSNPLDGGVRPMPILTFRVLRDFRGWYPRFLG